MRQIIIRSVAIAGVVVGVLFTGVGVAAAQPEVVVPAAPEVVVPLDILSGGVEADLGVVQI